jgi:hypothetical protein
VKRGAQEVSEYEYTLIARPAGACDVPVHMERMEKTVTPLNSMNIF